MSLRAQLDASAWADLESGLTVEQVADNDAIRHRHAINKDTLERRWFEADMNAAPIYRALNIQPDNSTSFYAVLPFRVMRVDDEWRIVAAYPCPDYLTPDDDWLGIATLIVWNPLTNKASVAGDANPQAIGSFDGEVIEVHASPRRFFQHWARNRAQFAVRRQMGQGHWKTPPKERDEAPGVLMVGNPNKIQWNVSNMPTDIRCFDCDPRQINKAIIRAARLPFATTGETGLRVAA